MKVRFFNVAITATAVLSGMSAQASVHNQNVHNSDLFENTIHEQRVEIVVSRNSENSVQRIDIEQQGGVTHRDVSETVLTQDRNALTSENHKVVNEIDEALTVRQHEIEQQTVANTDHSSEQIGQIHFHIVDTREQLRQALTRDG